MNTLLYEKLKELRDITNKEGLSLIKSQLPLPLGDVATILKPFEAIQNCIDREIRKLEKSRPIEKKSALSG